MTARLRERLGRRLSRRHFCGGDGIGKAVAAEPSSVVDRLPHEAHEFTMHNPRKKPAAPSFRTRLSAEQRRALGLLAGAGRNGVTGPLLAAYGFDAATIVGLVGRGLATMAQEKIKAGGKLIEVARVRITENGREALAAAGG
jgi:hypothetical protein